MRLITLQCPECGAKLNANAELTRASCNYCGNEILIDDEVKQVNVTIENSRQMGYDFERGRMDARNAGPNRKLAALIDALKEPVCALNDLRSRQMYLESRIAELRRKAPDAGSLKYKLQPFIPGAIILFFCLMAKSFPAFLIGFMIGAVIYVVQKRRQDTMEEQRRGDLYTAETVLKSVLTKITRLEAALSQHRIDLIPPAYRNRQAMTFFYEAIMNQRAATMPEAVNLYEEELHRKEMKAMHAQQIALQMEQNRRLESIDRTGKINTAANVTGSVLVAASTLSRFLKRS